MQSETSAFRLLEQQFAAKNARQACDCRSGCRKPDASNKPASHVSLATISMGAAWILKLRHYLKLRMPSERPHRRHHRLRGFGRRYMENTRAQVGQTATQRP